jgi:hypothetical protein
LRDIGLHDAQQQVALGHFGHRPLAGKARKPYRHQGRDRGAPAGGRRGEHEERQEAETIDAEQGRALQQGRGERPDMAERVPRITGEDMAAQPFGRRPADRQQNQPAISSAERGPTLDQPPRHASREAGKKPSTTARPGRWAAEQRNRRAARSGLDIQ